MLIFHKGHTDTRQVYSVTVMTHVKALQAGHSSQGTSEPITPVHTPPSESFRTKLSTSGHITRPMFWNPYLFFLWADYLDILQYWTTIY